jgi:hypothetical protein
LTIDARSQGESYHERRLFSCGRAFDRRDVRYEAWTVRAVFSMADLSLLIKLGVALHHQIESAGQNP